MLTNKGPVPLILDPLLINKGPVPLIPRSIVCKRGRIPERLFQVETCSPPLFDQNIYKICCLINKFQQELGVEGGWGGTTKKWKRPHKMHFKGWKEWKIGWWNKLIKKIEKSTRIFIFFINFMHLWQQFWNKFKNAFSQKKKKEIYIGIFQA